MIISKGERDRQQDIILMRSVAKTYGNERVGMLLENLSTLYPRCTQYILDRLEHLTSRGYLAYDTGCDGYPEQTRERWVLTPKGEEYISINGIDNYERTIRAREEQVGQEAK